MIEKIKIIIAVIFFVLINIKSNNGISHIDKEKSVEKENHLFIVNNEDSIVTDAKSFFESINVESIEKIETIDDEKQIRESGFNNIINIIKIQIKNDNEEELIDEN